MSYCKYTTDGNYTCAIIEHKRRSKKKSKKNSKRNSNNNSKKNSKKNSNNNKLDMYSKVKEVGLNEIKKLLMQPFKDQIMTELFIQIQDILKQHGLGPQISQLQNLTDKTSILNKITGMNIPNQIKEKLSKKIKDNVKIKELETKISQIDNLKDRTAILNKTKELKVDEEILLDVINDRYEEALRNELNKTVQDEDKVAVLQTKLNAIEDGDPLHTIV